jgi:RNA polymerase sigma-70 factor (ECF subfamily)
MTRSSVTIPQPEVLISHAGFIRAVAQRLLLDDHEVDDVVQQTLLAALEKPPRRALKPWLAAVAGNLARMRRRTEGRLHRREKVAAVPEAVTATDEIAERLDMQRRVVDAVTSLEDKYRDVVVLRFFDELPPREAAAKLDIPVETVRTRTRRALEQLRTRLDDHPGGRKGWQLALLPLALPPRAAQAAAGTAAAGILGAIGMKSILAIAAALLATVVLLWKETNAVDGDEPRRATEIRDAGRAGGTALADAGAPADRSDGEGAGGTERAPRDFTFRAVVVDPAGEPIRGARVVGNVRGFNRREVDLRTGADGEIEIGGVAGDRDVALRVEHPDYTPEFAFLPSWSEETEKVTLKRGSALRVRVISPLGEPVEGARYKASLVNRSGGEWIYWNDDDEGETARDGMIDFGRVPPIELHISVDHPGFEYFEGEFEGELVASGLVTVQLRAGGRIKGSVLAPDGEPLAGALVRTEHREAKSDGEGNFVLEHVLTKGVSVSAQHPDYAPAAFGEAAGWRRSVPVRVDDGAVVEGIEIRLAPPTRVTGRIVDEQGEPVAGFQVTSYCSGGYTVAGVPASGADGRFVAGPWKITEPTKWRMQRTKTETHRLAKDLEFDIRPGQTLEVGDIVVQARPAIRFRVAMPDGSAAPARSKAELEVTLTKRHEERAWNDFYFAQRSEFPVAPDGACELRLDRAVYTVRARAEGGLRSDAVVVDTAKVTDGEVVLELHPTVTVSGEVRGAGGAPDRGARLALLPVETAIPWDPGAADRTLTDADGRFEFHVSKPGEYWIGVPQNASNTQQGFAESPKARRITVGSQAVENIRFDVVGEREGAAVHGRVVSAETGRPIVQLSLSFVRYKLLFAQHTLMTGSWDREGKFETVLDTPGSYACIIRADGYSAVTTARFDVKTKGDIDLGTIQLPPALTLRGTVADAQGVPVHYAQVHLLGSGGNLRESVFTDSMGRFAVEQSDVGVFNVFAVSPRHPVAVLRGVPITKDGPNEIEIKLPDASPLTVYVKDENGRPVEGAQFIYTFPAVAPFTSEEFGGYEPPSYGANESDAEGVIHKPFMPAARLTLRFTKKGFETVQRAVDTEKGKPVDLEVVLKRKN